MAPVQRVEETNEGTPRIRARGHLALVDWGEARKQAAEVSEAMPPVRDPVRRTPIDKLYEHGIIVLLLVIILAVFASLTHL